VSRTFCTVIGDAQADAMVDDALGLSDRR